MVLSHIFYLQQFKTVELPWIDHIVEKLNYGDVCNDGGGCNDNYQCF